MKVETLKDMSLSWYFGKTRILYFDGENNKSSRIPEFQSGRISTSAFLKGDASLTLDKNEAKAGKYTCDVTEIYRRWGKQMVELKYSKWHYLNMVYLYAYTSGIWMGLVIMLGG